MDNKVYDLVGVGVGAFNLSLSALLDNLPEVESVFFFLDQKPYFDWRLGMLIVGTRLQVPFMADLVSLANPTIVCVQDIHTEDATTYKCKYLVIGTGSDPVIPESYQSLSGENVYHISQFLERQDRCRKAKSIAVVGSGQSSAEVFHELFTNSAKALFVRLTF
ncbi:SidA/IucD/PvdA family monooxygenase [Salipaludibacillus neizhouensis]|nr:SidA/IucD/PvdA family monooxygenase [Salipaludibacillus neizhouensis]